MGKIIGIDLGTTFSCVSHVDEHGHAEIILNTEGQQLTASVVWVDGSENLVCGQLARDNAVAFPEDVIALAKRSMGRDVKLRAGGKDFTPQGVSAIILKKLKQDAERSLNEEISEVVITCPAFFGAAETQATKEAGEMAGFTVCKVFPEPVAAALAFGYENPQEERTLLVYDLGGGTFDITLFTLAPPDQPGGIPRIQMISTEGDRQLGGADWDRRIVDYVADEFVKAHAKTLIVNALRGTCGTDEEIERALDALDEVPKVPALTVEKLAETGLDRDSLSQQLDDLVIDPRADLMAAQDLQLKAERGKIALARIAKTTVVCQHAGLSQRVELTRERLLELTDDLLDRTRSATVELLEKKGYSTEQVDEVLCVGGATRMTMVRDMLETIFPGRVNTRIEPDVSVAQGAAHMAKLIEVGATEQDGALINLSSHGYGVLARDHQGEVWVYPVILKDRELPDCSAGHEEWKRPDYEHGRFFTSAGNQVRVVIEVYEHDALYYADKRHPEECVKIGSVIIDGLPANRPPQQEIFVTFSMDKNSLLTVEAIDVASGQKQRAELTTVRDTSVESVRAAAAHSEEMKRVLEDVEVQS